MNTYQDGGTSRGKIISIKRKHQFNLVIYFSNGDFSPRIYSNVSWTALFSEKLLSSQYALPHSSHFFRVTMLAHALLFWSSCFLIAATFLNCYFFRKITSSQKFLSKQLLSYQTSTEQLLLENRYLILQCSQSFETSDFQWRNLFRKNIPLEALIFRSTYFCTASTF